MIKLSKKHITIFCLVCVSMATVCVMVAGVKDNTPTPQPQVQVRPSYELGGVIFKGCGLEIVTSKYGPSPTDLPFECVEVAYIMTEEGLSELEEEIKKDIRVVYAEEIDFYYKEPREEDVIAAVAIYEFSKVEGAKAVYDIYYSGIEETGKAVNLIDVGEEGFYLYEKDCTRIIFKIDRFMVHIIGKAGVNDIAKITERNIERVELIPKVTSMPKVTPVTTPAQSPAPTPSVPGFGAIFAIGSLLVVAYLVLRRR